MKIRARLSNPDEFYYPDSDSPKHMAEFWTVLEGYRIKGRTWELNWSTHMFDNMNREIYSGDVVRITVGEHSNKKAYPNEIEYGYVDYMDGCYLILNDDGLVHDFMDEFPIEIVGNVYENA